MSACLLGEAVRHDGGDKRVDDPILRRWIEEGRVVQACPEVAGGLPVPRSPAEVERGEDGSRVIAGLAAVRDVQGKDVSAPFIEGARIALSTARDHGIRVAVLKEGSPSCGSSYVYDGTFTSTRVPNHGVTAAMLRDHGIHVFSETRLCEADLLLRKLERRRVPAETARLRFRELTRDDVPNLQRIFTDPVAMEFYPETKTEAETLEWIERVLNSYEETGFGLWAVIEKETGEFIGQVGLIPQRDVDGADEVEVAYLLVRDHWGKGFATEAAARCRDHAFEHVHCERVVSLIVPENGRSIRIARRNGLVKEKTVERCGVKHDVYVLPRPIARQDD